MAVKPETRIVTEIIRYMRVVWKFYGYHVHGNLMQRSGEPDLDGSIWVENRCIHMKIEVKTPEGEPSMLQIERLREYHRRGYLTGIVTSVADIDKLVRAYIEYLDEMSEAPFTEYLARYGMEDKWLIYII